MTYIYFIEMKTNRTIQHVHVAKLRHTRAFKMLIFRSARYLPKTCGVFRKMRTTIIYIYIILWKKQTNLNAPIVMNGVYVAVP